jgi:hypothetical protein
MIVISLSPPDALRGSSKKLLLLAAMKKLLAAPPSSFLFFFFFFFFVFFFFFFVFFFFVFFTPRFPELSAPQPPQGHPHNPPNIVIRRIGIAKKREMLRRAATSEVNFKIIHWKVSIGAVGKESV